MITLTYWQPGKQMEQLSTKLAVSDVVCPRASATCAYQPGVNLFGSPREAQRNKRGTTFFAGSKGSLRGLKL